MPPPSFSAPPPPPNAGTFDTKREGQGGGFKELDEAELEEARRRRQEFESQDMWVGVEGVGWGGTQG